MSLATRKARDATTDRRKEVTDPGGGRRGGRETPPGRRGHTNKKILESTQEILLSFVRLGRQTEPTLKKSNLKKRERIQEGNIRKGCSHNALPLSRIKKKKRRG